MRTAASQLDSNQQTDMAARGISIIALAICTFAAGAIGMQLARRTAMQQPALAVAEDLIQITPKRIRMRPSMITDCYVPQTEFGPHADRPEILVYANPAAIEYRRKHPHEFEYPVGTTFEKRKFSRPTDEEPDMATIMERRTDKGGVSDWRFALVSLADKMELPMSGRVTCAGCHQNFKDTGYVSNDSENALRQYLKIE
jgi:Cytochrome P460